MKLTRFLPLAMTLCATLCVAEETQDEGQRWSVIGARTVAPGSNVIEGSVGYSLLGVSFLHGVAPGLNVGGRLGFVYTVEGLPRDVAPGVKAQALLKFRFLDAGRISLGLTFEPGFFASNSYLQGQRLGLALPVGLRLGIAASSALAIAVTIDVPVWIEFGTFGGVNVPLLTGAGVEYFITSQLAVFARVRLGPTFRTLRAAEVAVDAALGVGYAF